MLLCRCLNIASAFSMFLLPCFFRRSCTRQLCPHVTCSTHLSEYYSVLLVQFNSEYFSFKFAQYSIHSLLNPHTTHSTTQKSAKERQPNEATHATPYSLCAQWQYCYCATNDQSYHNHVIEFRLFGIGEWLPAWFASARVTPARVTLLAM